MCLIIDNPNGLSIDRGIILNASKANADGWGIMSSRRGKIRMERGMTMAGVEDAIRPLEGIPHSVHFRFATHGTKSLENCHPFSVLNGRYALMHNGIMAIPRHDAKRSDTWHFANHVLGPILKSDPDLFGSDYLTDLLSALIGTGNKLVIMRSDGANMIVNRRAGVDHDGLWLSNDYSLPLPKVRTLWRDSDDGMGWEWDDEPADDGEDLPEPAEEFVPRSLDDLAGIGFGDLVEFLESSPSYAAELILDHLEAWDAR